MKSYLLAATMSGALFIVTVHAALMTTQTGNGPFADGDIWRNLGGTTWPPATTMPIRIGDDTGSCDLEIISRGFVGFDLSGISAPSIANASLYLFIYQSAANLGNITIDRVDFGASLDSADYDIVAIQADIASFSAGQKGYLAIDVTDAVNAALADGKIQFRMRAELEQAMIGQNIVFINSIEDRTGSGEVPMLDITLPEPATFVLLTLSALLIRKQK